MLTAVLVDDMSNALELLQSDIALNHPEVSIIGTASSVIEAAKLLRIETPDILFLDIMLGDGTGFDLLEIVPELSSKVVFVTASDEFALRAFKFAAIDYILKPYTDEDLSNAIEKAKRQLSIDKQRLSILKKTLEQPTEIPERISLSTLDKISVVEIKDIIRCESDNNNTMFYFSSGQKIFVTKTLKYFTDLLLECGFIRTHQSHLINKSYIREYIKSDGGYLILSNGVNIPVSVRKRAEILEKLSKL
ncbi:LytR/AlgR family response regulator transcription factor [Urechidicola vernalis]|uniref:LytTR family DNA-binding domain-containing protein n=1 Tax=Urechidicola vernalis TaxID=3075600 RepID=A0ABU2Y112_9FLAO|nr:LytTR family DNA-binding domain-containing protein [Urechidicola sp. P050]MDT0551806.1 LytTR family DNA-binding domain-containing protein [Urechidicola sp. P050]